MKFDRGDIVICDFKLPDGNAIELMEWLDRKDVGCSVFVITDVETVADAVASFRAGAKDYINKRLIRELLIPEIKTFNCISGDSSCTLSSITVPP